MSVPSSVTKINKNGVQFVSNVDAVSYTLKELCRAAMRDVGKFVAREFKNRYYSAFKKRSGRVGRFTQYWVKHKYEDYPNVQVGLKANAFYGMYQEIGSSNQPRLELLTKSAQENVDMIVKIESQYLSALSEEDLPVVEETDFEGGADD